MSVNFDSAKSLAARTGWPESRIRKLVAENQLRHIKIGRSIYLPEGALEEFLETHMIEPSEPKNRPMR